MWYLCLLILIGICAWQAYWRGPNMAVGTTVFLTLLFPAWFSIDFFGLPLNMQTAATIAALGFYCIHRESAFRTRLIVTDFAGIALVATHLVSDWNADGFSWLVFLRAYGEWIVPYLAGRVAIQSWEDGRRLAPLAVVLCLVFAALALVESIVKVNVFELLVGIRPVEGTPRDLTRWGIRRAYGTTMNPIFFGNLVVMLLPWATLAAAVAYRKSASRWLFAGPPLACIAIVCSGSRAPLLAIVPAALIAAWVVWPDWRRVLLAGVGGVLLVGLIFHQQIWAGLNKYSAKYPDLPPPKITVAGEQVPYTGTMHRFYLIRVYSTAMRRAGGIGFGTERTTGFPPRVPVGPEHVETLKRLWCIDNFYVLFTLRFGYAGVACFLLMTLSAFFALLGLSRQDSFRRRVMCGGLAGGILAILLVLGTVWMPYDFGFFFMWTIGAAAGLCAHEGLGFRL